MILRQPCRIPEEQQQALSKAVRLEWWTLFFLSTIGVAMYLTMGSSQAMKTAWIEDLLSMVPPILFLVSIRVHDQEPTARYPYGKRRIVMIAFLGAALALLALGGFLLTDALLKLIQQEHPTIGVKTIFGHQVWLGWLMIAVLGYSILPPLILGHLKAKPAETLHEKTLHADAAMNKADWMTGLAAIAGILGVGAGLWWADGVAAAVISTDIVWDGFKNVKRALADLADAGPTTVDKADPDSIVATLRSCLRALPWVADADVRLREEGHVVAGEAYVVPVDETALVARCAEAEAALRQTHWRVCDVVVVPLSQETFDERRAAS